MTKFHEIVLDSESKLLYAPAFLTKQQANSYFQQLKDSLAWQAEKIRLFGKEYWQPRLLAWYGDSEASYRYSGILHQPLAWTAPLQELRNLVEQASQGRFNSVLANLYRNGQDSMGWHSDDEPELGDQPLIASLSLGGTRRFALRPRKGIAGQSQRFDLPSGSLLLMQGRTQECWQHQISKTKKQVAPRINLTFRWIYPPS